MTQTRQRISSLLLCAATVLLHNNASGSEQDSADLYQATCSVCHGEHGDGRSHAMAGMNPPPRDFTDSELHLTREFMIHIVRNGKPGTAMSAYDTMLDSRQIEGLVDYIRDRFMRIDDTKSIAAQPAADHSAGSAIYASTCSVCHGEDGAGAMWGKTSLSPPPVNFRTTHPVRDLPRERMIHAVTYGRPGTAMTAFASQLDESGIAAVVDYIRASFMQGRSGAVTTPVHTASSVGSAVLFDRMRESDTTQRRSGSATSTLSMPGGLDGDPERGHLGYMQNCSACHGTEGRGDGPRAYFIYPRPRNFQHDTSRERFDRAELYLAISKGVVGREMPAWDKVMNEQQIADITEYVYITFIRPE